ncbi:lysine--tRNA ligase [Afifella aestuarii]|uniref:lysine--tRNA ligase n=1 Tax=Afifella aestuarii TaxID=1909496 RepID=UPI000FE36B39|nr:lysine--tRNA ligase [Afifella aestuarii]
MSAQSLPEEWLAAAQVSKAWPFEEARKLIDRLEKRGGDKREILFETGYGPSGLPHIGTFGEVARTTMVRHAFSVLTKDSVPTRLLCFSDDMDGLRKVPENVPNREMMESHLGKPLTEVPDPFSNEYDSFGRANNARLRAFLDTFGFEYEFASATDYYKSGRFDETLLKMLAVYEKVRAIILPTLGEERRATYSPFLPICPRTGIVLQVPTIARNPEAGTITYLDPETKEEVTVGVTGGQVKCQWKADWALRWTALGVDYEMAGKDLIDSVRLSSQICRALGGNPPEGFNYELFLDENGEKISKSRGNGLTIDEWLAYASPESLALYMFQKPRSAKRLYFDVIPRAVDEYFSHLAAYDTQAPEQKIVNPVWHIHSGKPPEVEMPVSFAMLLNLVSASNSEDARVLWGFISRYAPGASAESHPALNELVGYAIRYYNDFVKPTKSFRAPSDTEKAALADLDQRLTALPDNASGEEIQNEVYAVGKAHDFGNLRDWFQALYQVLLGQDQGPRFGSFVALYGIGETRALIAKALEGKLAA